MTLCMCTALMMIFVLSSESFATYSKFREMLYYYHTKKSHTLLSKKVSAQAIKVDGL